MQPSLHADIWFPNTRALTITACFVLLELCRIRTLFGSEAPGTKCSFTRSKGMRERTPNHTTNALERARFLGVERLGWLEEREDTDYSVPSAGRVSAAYRARQARRHQQRVVTTGSKGRKRRDDKVVSYCSVVVRTGGRVV